MALSSFFFHSWLHSLQVLASLGLILNVRLKLPESDLRAVGLSFPNQLLSEVPWAHHTFSLVPSTVCEKR